MAEYRRARCIPRINGCGRPRRRRLFRRQYRVYQCYEQHVGHCDCVAHPADVELADYGILASTDPVALDKACCDIIFNMTATDGNDNAPLKERISSRHGLHTIDHAAAIGLGNLEYEIVDLDK